MGHGVRVEVRADFKQLPTLFTWNAGFQIRVFSQSVRLQRHLGTKPETTFSTDKVFGVTMNQTMGI